MIWHKFFTRLRHDSVARTALAAHCLVFCIVLYLISGAALAPDFFLGGWMPSEGARFSTEAGLVRFCLLVALFIPLLRLHRKSAPVLLGMIVAVTLALCLRELFDKTGGLALYRDDHPSFIFRFWSIARTLPRLTCSFWVFWFCKSPPTLGIVATETAFPLPRNLLCEREPYSWLSLWPFA